VAITANAVYVASYHTNAGHYADDQNFFANSGVDNGPLHLLQDGVSGGNGVYAYGAGSNFPDQSWRSSNYWVDVVFSTDAGGDGSSGSLADILESGDLTVDSEWTCVDFGKSFVDPVIVPGPASGNGGDPAVVRVEVNPQDCSFGANGGFAIRIQEWGYLDDQHVSETVSYLVMERGSHRLSDGTQVEAGRLETDSTSGFVRTDFEAPFPDGVIPVVVTAVTSVNEADAVTTRVRNIDSSGFEVRMQEQEKNAQQHAKEMIDYIAWGPSADVVDGMAFEVGRTADVVTDRAYTLVFDSPQGAFTAAPYLLAGMQTTDGGDTADLRWLNRDVGAVDLWVDEEQSRDSETRHTTESIGYILLSPLP
jgi:hypothetical protein